MPPRTSLVLPKHFYKTKINSPKTGSVEIPDLTSLPEIHGEPVFHGYHKGGYLSCQMVGQIRENGQKTVFDVPKEHVKIIIRLFYKCRSGGGEAPKNVMKNDDFYRAQ